MLRPFLEQRLYQTSTPAKLAEYWQARVSTRGNELSERVILAGNALPATPSEPVSRSRIAPAGGTKPEKGTLARIASPPDGKRQASSPRQSGIETSRHQSGPAPRPPRCQIRCRLVPAPAAARTPAPCPFGIFTTADPPARRQSGPRPTPALPNPMPARSRSGSSPHPGTLPLRRFHDGRPAGTPSIRPASDIHAAKSDAGSPSKKTAPPDGGALIISQ